LSVLPGSYAAIRVADRSTTKHGDDIIALGG